MGKHCQRVCDKALSFQSDQLGHAAIIIPEGELPFANGDYLFVPDIRKAVEEKADVITAYKVGEELVPFTMTLGELTDEEREIILKGCLINYNRVSWFFQKSIDA